MLRAAITGGIGSGKSTVCTVFQLLDIPVFHADEVAQHILQADEQVIRNIKKHFGEAMYNRENIPERKKIASLVFKDPKKLEMLNSWIHPAVALQFQQWVQEQTASPYCILEAAILFESGFHKNTDKIILVTAPEEIRIQRVMKRDRMSEDEVRSRMRLQWSNEQKISLSDFVIVNDDSSPVIPQVMDIHSRLLEMAECNGKN